MADILKVKLNNEWVSIPAMQGPQGPTGETGATGPTGPGVAAGGTAGQILSKIDGTDYNTQWVNTPDISGKENSSNKVTSITSSSTNTEYPSALAVYNFVNAQTTAVETASY